jgi:hypothetical protein
LIFAGGAAGLAIHQAIGAETDVDHRLAQAAVFFALAVAFGLFTLSAAEFGWTGSGIHRIMVAESENGQNMTVVIEMTARANHRRRIPAPCSL